MSRSRRGTTKVPYFYECQRPSCGQLKQVRRPSEQKRHKYCSRKCAAMVLQNIKRAYRKGVENSARARMRRVVDRVAGLSAIEAFRVGYDCGLRSKLRQLRKRYTFQKKADGFGSHPR